MSDIDFSKRVSGKRCEDCSEIHTHVLEVRNGFAKHYCNEHWPLSKNDWRHDALREAWLKNKELMVKINPGFDKLSPFEQYRATREAYGGKLDVRMGPRIQLKAPNLLGERQKE